MSRPSDLSGLPTSLTPAEIGRWNRIILGVLSHSSSTASDLQALLVEVPDFALGHALRGISCLLLGRRELFAVARQAHAAATGGSPSTARETAYVDALGDWLEGRPSRASGRLQAVLDDQPTDALAMKLVHSIEFVMGRPAAMRASVEDLLDAWVDHPAQGYILGCHAFALEETGDFAGAERAGRAAVALAPDDAWGLHAVAHVFDMTGRACDGLEWLSGREASWAHCSNFRFHVWWHRALMHVDLARFDAALEDYDKLVRAEETDDYRDLANAASLLTRLELEGVPVGRRWDELADIAERRTSDACLAFADLHYMLALSGAERGAAASRLMARMSAPIAGDCEASKVIAHTGARIAAGVLSFASGDHHMAAMTLRDACADLQRIGGSHAQRDVFVRLAIEAAFRAGRLDAAEGLLRERIRWRGEHLDGYTLRRLSLFAAARREAV
jgi:tetratricopeptide (TPR) repeat protein